MIKPNFLIIGAAKAGTTSIWSLLQQHPDVCMSKPKEPNFFSRDYNYSKGWSWYESFFKHHSNEICIGDASTCYTGQYYSKAAQRLKNDLPNAKLIYIVRHPLDKIESSFLHNFRNTTVGYSQMPKVFSKAVTEYKSLIQSCLYYNIISEYRKYFTDEQIKILFFEDFIAAPHAVLSDICRFLNVDYEFNFTDIFKRKNASDGRRQSTSSLRKLKRIKIINYIKPIIPKNIKNKIKHHLSTPLPTKKILNGSRNYVDGR